MSEVQPFRIDVTPVEVEDLIDRLRRRRFAEQLPGEEWAKGVPASWLRTAVQAWQEQDWSMTQDRLNAFPQIVTEIDGQRVHAIHVTSKHDEATPLLLLHGWPGSFLEFVDLIGPLVNPTAHGGDAADAFHVVIPSLPGHGFSSPLAGEGWTDLRMGDALGDLMFTLGYERFAVQGGDAGAFIGPQCARAHPDAVIGVHVNALVNFPGPDDNPDELTEAEKERVQRQQHFLAEMSGYREQQQTRPQTLAYALTDSPAGQLAWIAEKFAEWSDPHHVLTKDPAFLPTLLADASIYWFTGTAGSSANLYWETMHNPEAWTKSVSGVPTAVLVSLTQDVAIRRYAERENRIVRWTETERGGHFMALEAPEVWLEDVRAFFRSLR
ncbi:alpha/beta fold hydrolase (plasmid) [Rathayibacter sp. VKM Ac-2803]|nr:alpha/beta fold hydrolase [Rathayibacter sp. VKM Ac-2803]